MTPSMRRPKLRRPRHPEGRNPRPARPFAPPGPRRPRICGKRNFPLDFARRIRYNNIHDKPVRRDAEGVARDLLRQMHRALQCFGGPAPAVSRRQGAGPQPGHSHRPMWRNGRRKRLKIVRETMWVRVPPSAPGWAWTQFAFRPGFFFCRPRRTFLVLDTGVLNPYNKHRHCKKDGDRDDL